MSIDKLTADLLNSVAGLTAAVEKNTAILERVLAGQEAAMAKLESGAGTTRKPRQTKAEKEAEAAGTTTTPTPEPEPAAQPHVLLASPNGETKKNAKDELEPTGNYRAADFSRQEIKNEFIGWLGETSDINERKARAAFVGELAAHFGVQKPFDPEAGISGEDSLKQTLFFLRRKREGLKVDFNADYDFDGDPLADQTPDADGDDGIDALG